MSKATKPDIYESVERKRKNSKPTLVRTLDGIEEARQMAAFLDGIEGAHQIQHHLDDRDFCGRSWDDSKAVFECLNAEHEKTQDQFERCLAGLESVNFPRPQSIRKKARIREDGERLDFQRHRDGDPNRYWHTRKVRKPGGHSTVIVAQNFSASARVDTWGISWRGAAGAALCKILTDAGYQVEYWLYTHTYEPFKGKGDLEQGIRVKEANAYPDWIKMANLTSGWFFRSVLFSLYASDLGNYHEEDKPKGDFGGGAWTLGRPSHSWGELLHLQDRIANGRPVIDVGGKIFSEKEAIKAVTKSAEDFIATI